MFERRLARFLTRIGAPLAVGACALGPLNDEYCLTLDEGETQCPSTEDAADIIVGRQTCEGPVRKVVRTGELLYSEDFTPTPYGYDAGPPPDTGLDTGTAPDSRTRCCYEARYRKVRGLYCVVGRPLLIGGEVVVADEVARPGWSDARVVDADVVARLTPEAREALAAAWTETGLLEHASVPAFARLVLELTALGAPARLVARATEAMADEIRHAQSALALASAYAGHPVGPSALAVPPLATASLVDLAVATFREGCVGETLAVAIAAAQRQGATDPVVRHVLDGIIADETRHAALAWDIVQWALGEGGDTVREALMIELADLHAPTPEVGLPPRGCVEHGIADPALLAAVTQGVMRDVIAPEARALLAAR